MHVFFLWVPLVKDCPLSFSKVFFFSLWFWFLWWLFSSWWSRWDLGFLLRFLDAVVVCVLHSSALSEYGLHSLEEVVDPYPFVVLLYELEPCHEVEDFVKGFFCDTYVSGHECPLEIRVWNPEVVRVCQNLEEYAI